MRLIDIYWLARIVDGEGCFSLISDKYPRLSVRMTDKDTIQKVADILKTNVWTDLNSPGKIVHAADISGSKAAAWMMILYSIMSSRRKAKIKEILLIWLALDRTYKDNLTCKHGHDIKYQRHSINGKSYCLLCKRNNMRRYLSIHNLTSIRGGYKHSLRS